MLHENQLQNPQSLPPSLLLLQLALWWKAKERAPHPRESLTLHGPSRRPEIQVWELEMQTRMGEEKVSGQVVVDLNEVKVEMRDAGEHLQVHGRQVVGQKMNSETAAAIVHWKSKEK